MPVTRSLDLSRAQPVPPCNCCARHSAVHGMICTTTLAANRAPSNARVLPVRASSAASARLQMLVRVGCPCPCASASVCASAHSQAETRPPLALRLVPHISPRLPPLRRRRKRPLPIGKLGELGLRQVRFGAERQGRGSPRHLIGRHVEKLSGQQPCGARVSVPATPHSATQRPAPPHLRSMQQLRTAKGARAGQGRGRGTFVVIIASSLPPSSFLYWSKILANEGRLRGAQVPAAAALSGLLLTRLQTPGGCRRECAAAHARARRLQRGFVTARGPTRAAPAVSVRRPPPPAEPSSHPNALVFYSWSKVQEKNCFFFVVEAARIDA